MQKTLFHKWKDCFDKGEESSILNAKFLYIVLANSFTFHSLAFDATLNEFAERFLRNCLWNFGVFFTLLYVCSFLKVKIYQIILNILFWFGFIVASVNLFLLINFNFTLNSVAIEIFFATNAHEAAGFIDTYSNQKTIIALILFAVTSIACFFFTFSFSFSRRLHTFIAVICLVIVSGNLIKKDSVLRSARKTQTFYVAGALYYEMKQFEKINIELAKFRDEMQTVLNEKMAVYDNGGGGLKYISQEKPLPKIIFIIGEATQRHYMSLYGYALPTTPNFDTLKSSENLFAFDDVVSPVAGTNESLKRILTFFNNDTTSQIPWYKQMNIIDAMKLLDYRVIFLSTQEPISSYGAAPQTISRNADNVNYANLHKIGKEKDERLLVMYDDFNQQKHSLIGNEKTNEFYIFHIEGMHAPYIDRYTQQFDKFSIKDLRQNKLDEFHHYKGNKNAGQKLTDKQLKYRAHYINAILYNDFVISEFIKKLADDEVILFYFSDHGEEINDFRDFVGHAGDSKYNVEIPFIIYMSDKFKARHPEILTKVKNAQHKPFMTDNFMHAFFDLLNIQCVESNETLSLFNQNYDDTRIRMIYGKDYDKELK